MKALSTSQQENSSTKETQKLNNSSTKKPNSPTNKLKNLKTQLINSKTKKLKNSSHDQTTARQTNL